MNKNAFREISISDVKNAFGDKHIDSDFIIAQSDELPVHPGQANEPVRLEGGALAICLNGEASVTVNLHAYTLRKGCLLVVPPHSVIEYHNHSVDFKIYLVGFSPDIFEGMHLFGNVLPLMTEILKSPLFEISEADTELIIRSGRYIAKKATESDHPHRKQIMQHLIISLFYEISYIFQRQRSSLVVRQKTHNEEVMEDFGRLLSKHYRTERNVEFYADQLCLTPKYLSTLIKNTSGRSVPEWIRYALVMDAKMQLKYSTQTVQQISEDLHFPNPSFFGRFFKKHAGVTPLEYRMGE